MIIGNHVSEDLNAQLTLIERPQFPWTYLYHDATKGIDVTLLAWAYCRSILPLSKQLGSYPPQVTFKCRCVGSLRDADDIGVHQGKTEVGEASSSVAMNEYIRLELTSELT